MPVVLQDIADCLVDGDVDGTARLVQAALDDGAAHWLREMR